MHRARPPTGARHRILPGRTPSYTLGVESDTAHTSEAHPPPADDQAPPVPRVAPSNDLTPFEVAARQRLILLRIVRAGFFILLVTVAILSSAVITVPYGVVWWFPIVAAFVLAGAALYADLATSNKRISAIAGVFLGVLAGLLGTVALSLVMDLLLQVSLEEQSLKALGSVIVAIKLMLGITLCYLGVTTVLQTQDDFRLVIPYVEFAKQIRGPRPLVLDSSALIDARIVDLCQTGIVQTPVLVPRFVVGELQVLADSGERLKRAKGRRGLDVIVRLQRLPGLDISIDETLVPGKAVDQMLIELARRLPATIVTTDTGLNRVASIQGVQVLNLNDVANALKPALIPGEQLSIRLLKRGEQPGQGVGYLEDGTMVVAEDGGPRIGEQVTLTVTSTLQTSAGRLIFGRMTEPDAGARPALSRPEPGPAAPPAQPDGTPAPDSSEESRGPDAAAVGPVTADEAMRRTPYPPHPPRRPNPARNPRR